jgi:Rad51
MSSRTSLQYYCSNCKTILREGKSELDISCISEPCPFCGSLLSESLQKRCLGQKNIDRVFFQPASKVSRLTIDIEKMDSILYSLGLNQKVAIVGTNSQKLVERLAVRAQLPHRYGGLDSHVILVDGGNSSDPYMSINFARQYGLDVNHMLSKVISSRAFTIYQLENLITHELSCIISRYNAKMIIISDLTEMFSDPYLDDTDAQKILDSILNSISKLKECLVIVSISKCTKYDYILKSFDKIIHLSNKNDSVLVEIDNKNFTLKQNDLELVSHR